MSEILVCCPSRDRPGELMEAVESFLLTSTDALLSVYADEDQIQDYGFMREWADKSDRIEFTTGKRMGAAQTNNFLAAKHPEIGIVGTATDDCVFATPGWDKYVVGRFDSWTNRIGVVSPWHHSGGYVSFPYVSRQWIETVGWYVHPGVYHFAWDTVIQMLGDATNIDYCEPENFTVHHKSIDRPMENVYDQDRMNFIWWCVTDRPAIVRRLRQKAGIACGRLGSA